MIFSSIKNVSRKVIHLIRPSYEREQLHYLLSSANPDGDLAEQIAWLEQLMFWVRTLSPNRHGFDRETGQLHNVRIRFILHLLERNPEWKAKVGACLRKLVEQTSARSLFSQTGLGQHKGFISEASDRILKRILPQPAEEKDLSELFLRIFDDEQDAVWVSHIPVTLFTQLRELIAADSRHPEKIFSGWKKDLEDAILILGARVSSQGTSPEMISRLESVNVEGLPFLKINQTLFALIYASRQGKVHRDLIEECLAQVQECNEKVLLVYARLEETGVSVGLVYLLENISSLLHRLDLLVELLMPQGEGPQESVAVFLANLVQERLSQSTLRSLVRTNLHLLSSKIVERAGATGEHYITHDRKEYLQMMRVGTGGGAIMVGTTITKFFLMGLKLPLLFEGIFFSINYAGSFLVLQLCGFTLATKQPSATASALAGKLKDLQEDGEIREFVNIASRMTRSQFAALVGNLILLVPLAILLDFGVVFSSGRHILGAKTAHHVFETLNPLTSVTIPMAMLTGVLLWTSSIVAGWLENWVVFRRIPEALASQRRLVQVFGKSGAQKIGKWVLKNATLLGGNISLGVMMGFTAVAGRFVGLPLDVRHVTLAAASLTLGACSWLSEGGDFKILILPIFGVLIIGALNFAVGYSLAFAVAVRARNVNLAALRRLFRAIRARLRNRPGDFFFPPAEKENVAAQ